jgi:hypothetical protein
MHKRQTLAATLLVAGLCLQAVRAEAILIARVTRHGYILTDDPDSTKAYGNIIPTTNTRETVTFISDVTNSLLDVEGFRPGRFLAAMQLPSQQSPLAFYLPIRNDVRGIGQRSVVDGRAEVFDNNRFYNTGFALDGFVFLNSMRFYTDPNAVTYGRFLICTQEFGHRFGANAAVPAWPGVVPSEDGGLPDGSAPLDASADVPSPGDASLTDGPRGDAPLGPQPLEREALLGRGNQLPSGMVVNRAHWSYFFNSGGSPMEGNAWLESTPGTFTTQRPSFRFSDLDLYLMGLIPPDQVRPSFLIAEPTMVPSRITRDSPPEYYNRQVTLRGRRVTITIDDIVRANGPRNPAWPTASRDLDVVGVLLADAEDVTDSLANEFDEAIESCSAGYAFATAERGHLVAVTPPVADAGTDAGADVTAITDAATEGGVTTDASVTPTDATADASAPIPNTASGGCQCMVPRPSPDRSHGALVGAMLVAGLCLAARRRRRSAA